MPTIDVHKPFLLNLKSGVRHAFTVGLHEVSEEVASHWYVADFARVVEEVKQEAEDLVTEAEEVIDTVKPKSKRRSKLKAEEAPAPEVSE